MAFNTWHFIPYFKGNRWWFSEQWLVKGVNIHNLRKCGGVCITVAFSDSCAVCQQKSSLGWAQNHMSHHSTIAFPVTMKPWGQKLMTLWRGPYLWVVYHISWSPGFTSELSSRVLQLRFCLFVCLHRIACANSVIYCCKIWRMSRIDEWNKLVTLFFIHYTFPNLAITFTIWVS